MDKWDDEAWFELVAGRPSGGTDAATNAEATLFRAASLRWKPSVDDIEAIDPIRTAALVERAREAGLLAPRSSSLGARVIGWLSRALRGNGYRRLAGVAAMCLALGTALVLYRFSLEPTVGTRQDERTTPDAVFVIKHRDPEALKKQLMADLERSGAKARGYTRLGRQGIDAELPQPLPSELRNVLGAYRIPVPVDSILRIEIEAAPP